MNLPELTLTAEEDRNEKWQDEFLRSLSESKIQIMSPDPQVGPDGWPYLFAATENLASPEAGQELEPAQSIFHWLSTRGIGLVVNPQKSLPDFVLTYGMLWNFLETGKFINRQTKQTEWHNGKVQLDQESNVKFGEAKPEFLPEYVRVILRQFFLDQGIYAAKYLLISINDGDFEMAFSVESLGNPAEGEWEGIAEAISWFLPSHYSILILSEKGFPAFSSI